MKPDFQEGVAISLRGNRGGNQDTDEVLVTEPIKAPNKLNDQMFKLASLNTVTSENLNAISVKEGLAARSSLADLARSVATATQDQKLNAFILSSAVVADNVREGLLDAAEASAALVEVVSNNDLAAIFGEDKVSEVARRAERRMIPAIWRGEEYPDPADFESTTDGGMDAVISYLASLPEEQYERVRKDRAKELGVRATALDRLVAKLRPAAAAENENGLLLPEPDLWDEPVDGDKLLTEIAAAITSYVVMPKSSADTAALWVVHSFAMDQFRISPRLAIQSPEKGCGKTTLLDVVTKLVWRPLPAANATASVIFRVVEKTRPTLLIDEADTFLKDNHELRGILNSGHRRGGYALRNVGDDHEPKRFSTWSACAIALIGRLPDTLEDRSVTVSLRRRKPDEKIKAFRFDETEDLDRLASMARRWANDHGDELRKCRPDMGDLQNRRADNWEPLFAIATVAGDNWTERAWTAAMTASAAEKEQSISTLLLSDIRECFHACHDTKIKSEELVSALIAIEDRPWGEWKGKPLSKNGLARLLNKFGISPATIRLDKYETAKGYKVEQFQDAFDRYLQSNGLLNRHNVTSAAAEAFPAYSETSQAKTALRFENGKKANSDGHCDVVTDESADNEAFEERASILEYEAGLPRAEAEARARQEINGTQ